MKTIDEYIMFIEVMVYDFISWTNLWLASPVTAIGPYNAVVISISHVFLGYFIVSCIGLLWLAFTLNKKEYYEQY